MKAKAANRAAADGPPARSDESVEARRAVMATLAAATPEEALAVLARLGGRDATDLRPVESGLVMLRGRMGGDGAPFNLGEATVTRAAVRLADGRTGFAWQLGRDRGKARAAAVIDALWQGAERDAVEAALAPLRARLAEAARLRAAEVAATRVDFFTLVRGED
jgi:alpha-D-ribose 1-methylphosphonate 5-triphosphate synthase subunit PhnG